MRLYIGVTPFNLIEYIIMKLYKKAIALCALAALPMGVVIAEPTTTLQNAAKADTKIVNLNVTGMH